MFFSLMAAGGRDLVGVAPFQRDLDDQRDEGKQSKQRGHGEGSREIVFVVENFDMQRHGVGLASDVARDHRHGAELAHGARVAKHHPVKQRPANVGQRYLEEGLPALSLGASGWKTFFKVTLPNIRWALLYGVVLCNARAMGEFGAVSVVSGHIRGKTNTMPLHVEILYNEYNFAAAFAVASLLALLALVTLVIKVALEWRYADQIVASRRH